MCFASNLGQPVHFLAVVESGVSSSVRLKLEVAQVEHAGDDSKQVLRVQIRRAQKNPDLNHSNLKRTVLTSEVYSKNVANYILVLRERMHTLNLDFFFPPLPQRHSR